MYVTNIISYYILYFIKVDNNLISQIAIQVIRNYSLMH